MNTTARRVAVAATAAALTLGLAGCAGGLLSNNPAAPDVGNAGYFHVNDVTVHGRTVPCVTWKNGYAGGLSCDWSAPR